MKLMKQSIAALFLLIALGACTVNGTEGPPGPQGPQGPQGPAAEVEYPRAYDLFGLSFVAPDYALLYEFPAGEELIQNDVVLVYKSTAVTESGDFIWEAMPHSLVFENGDIINYGFNHSTFDVELYIQSNFDRAQLTANETDDIDFRIVVVPAVPAARLDLTNYKAVAEYFDIKNEDIKKVNLK